MTPKQSTKVVKKEELPDYIIFRGETYLRKKTILKIMGEPYKH